MHRKVGSMDEDEVQEVEVGEVVDNEMIDVQFRMFYVCSTFGTYNLV